MNADNAATSDLSMYYKVTDSEWRTATKSDAHLFMRTGSSSVSYGTSAFCGLEINTVN